MTRKSSFRAENLTSLGSTAAMSRPGITSQGIRLLWRENQEYQRSIKRAKYSSSNRCGTREVVPCDLPATLERHSSQTPSRVKNWLRRRPTFSKPSWPTTRRTTKHSSLRSRRLRHSQTSSWLSWWASKILDQMASQLALHPSWRMSLTKPFRALAF